MTLSSNILTCLRHVICCVPGIIVLGIISHVFVTLPFIVNNMCTQPLYIKNPKKDFCKYNDKPFLVVPCGKCTECLEQKQRSFEVRAFYEYKWHDDKNGMSFYYTFTYNNFNLPHFDVQSKFSSISYRFNHFSHDHIKRLVEKIRKTFPHLVFLVTSEYGGQTRRPHYHAVFHLPYKTDPFAFYELVSSLWSYRGKSLGNVYVGSDYGVINSPDALKYIVKYVCKDDAFEDVKQRLIKSYYKSIYYDKFKVDETLWFQEHLKLITPFVYKSKCYGSHAFDYVNNISQSLGKISLPYISHDIPLPMYYFRKLYYDVVKDDNGNNRYVLNAAGVSRKLAIFNQVVDSNVSKIKALNNPYSVDRPLQDALFYYTHINFVSFRQIYEYLTSQCNIRDLVIYDYVYKDRLCTHSVTFVPEHDMKAFFTPFVMPFADARFQDDNNFLTFNNISFFDGYDNLLLIIRLCCTYFSYQRYVKRIKNKNSLSRVMMIKKGNDFCQESRVKSLSSYSKLFNYA